MHQVSSRLGGRFVFPSDKAFLKGDGNELKGGVDAEADKHVSQMFVDGVDGKTQFGSSTFDASSAKDGLQNFPFPVGQWAVNMDDNGIFRWRF
jgi:hypothetical protein